MLEHPKVDEDAIPVIGHQLFGSGKLSPKRLINKQPNVDEIANAIFDAYYKNSSFSENEVELVQDRISNNIEPYELNISNSSYEIVERWYWRSRIPCYLNVRALFLLADPWFPLLDKELCQFPSKIPERHRYNKRAYQSWVKRLYRES